MDQRTMAMNLYEELMDLCDLFDRENLWDKRGSEIALSLLLRTDLALFMLYLSVADETLSEAEAEVFRFVTAFPRSRQDQMDLYRGNRIIDSCGSTIPYSLTKIVEAQRTAFARGVQLPGEKTAQEIFADLCDVSGRMMLGADGDITPEETRMLEDYIRMLRQYHP